jgi:HEAT repeat protein
LTIDFSELILAVFWIAAAVGAASLLLIVQVTGMRIAGRGRRQHMERFEATWKAILDNASVRVDALPHVESADITVLMILWNEAQEAALRREDEAGPQTRRRLNEIAGHTGLVQSALRRIRRRDLSERLCAIILLGHSCERSAAPALAGLVASPSALISFASARALLQIDKTEGWRFVRLMVERTDWSPFKLLSVVRQEAASLAGPMIDAVLDFPPEASARLMPFLASFTPSRSMRAIRRILQTSTDGAQIREALKVLGAIGAADDADLAARFAVHPDWLVRVQAANGLGRLGQASQAPTLTRLLGDTHWWVRYRAAQALAKLDSTDGRLQSLLETQQDRFARDVLRQVIGERQLSLQGSSA